MDGRRRRWFPVSADLPFTSTGSRLLEEFGPAGLGVFVAALAWAKRSTPQGTIRYPEQAPGEAWAQLGVDDWTTLGWDLDDLWTCLGHLKQTRRTRHGRMLNVVFTQWARWNDPTATRSGRWQTPRSDNTNTDILGAEHLPDTGPVFASDSDIDNDSDNDTDTWARTAATVEVVEALIKVFGRPATPTGKQRIQDAARELAAAGASGEEVSRRYAAWSVLFPGATVTVPALVRHWDQLGEPSRFRGGEADRSGTAVAAARAEWAKQKVEEE